MPKTITIDVTAADIRAGVIGSCQFCPIARAVQRAIGTSRVHVSVEREAPVGFALFTLDDYDIKRGDERWHKPALPAEAVAFVKVFDRQESVKPFTFTVEFDPDDAAHFA